MYLKLFFPFLHCYGLNMPHKVLVMEPQSSMKQNWKLEHSGMCLDHEGSTCIIRQMIIAEGLEAEWFNSLSLSSFYLLPQGDVLRRALSDADSMTLDPSAGRSAFWRSLIYSKTRSAGQNTTVCRTHAIIPLFTRKTEGRTGKEDQEL